MREIKFRVWDKGNNRMASSLDCMPIIAWDKEKDCYKFEVRADDFILMQYTGLKDKNEKEIYEGDVVKIPGWGRFHKCEKCGHEEGSRYGLGVVSFETEYCYDERNSSVARYTFKTDSGEYELEDTETMEVIGNIYENQGFLDKEQ